MAIKTVTVTGTAYQVTDAHGNRALLQNSATKGAISIGPAGPSTAVHLTQANVVDLLPTLTAFANTGVLS